jgi:hypothetical protein
VYEMYAFDEAGATGAADTDAMARSGEADSEFSAALQFALDRRDNGGDAQGHPQWH